MGLASFRLNSRKGERLMLMSSLTGLWILWGAVTALLAVLLLYRSMIGIKEDDQLILDTDNPVESSLYAQQEALRLRLNKVGLYIRGLGVLSTAVLLVIAGVWIYRGIVGFTNPAPLP